jgi:heterodisulfide reductase subunit B
MDIAYFPGCSLHGMAKEYDVSTRIICRHLGISLKEVKDWNCCGATAAHSLDHLLSISLNVRTLALTRDMRLNCLMTPCAGCFSRLKGTSYEINHNPQIIDKVQDSAYLGSIKDIGVEHLLQFLVDRVGVETIKNKVQKPLGGLKLAAYYGCLITRPHCITQFDDSEQPVSMDKLLKALGAEPVSWSHKTECCGGGFAVSETAIVLDLGGQVLEAAREAGARAIVTACPMCQTNLDIRQRAIAKERGIDFNLPIIYLSQLIGLALGYSSRELGLTRLLVSPANLFS